MNKLCFFLMSLWLMSVSTMLQADDYWPIINYPIDAKVSWIAEDMNRNGYPMRIAQVESTMSSNELVDYYQRQWHGSKRPKVEKTDDLTVVSLLDLPYLYTAQINSTNRIPANAQRDRQTVGYVTIAKVDRVYPHPADSLLFEIPADFKLVTDVKSKDYGKTSRTVVAYTNRSVGQVLLHLQQICKADHWYPVNPYMQQNELDHREKVMIYQKGKRELTLVLSRDSSGLTRLVYTDVKSD